MPRPYSVHFPGALFHVTSRGSEKREIFLETRDYERYLGRLSQLKAKLSFKLYSYCLMPNHIHLLIEVKDNPLSKIMQVIQTGHAMFFNKKYNHVGYVFQGRYRWLLVEKESYLLELIRYINLNPIRAGIVERVEDWEFCSFQEIIGLKSKGLIEQEEILANFSQEKEKAIKNFKDFLKGGLEVAREDLFGMVVRNQFLGSDKFINTIERRILKCS